METCTTCNDGTPSGCTAAVCADGYHTFTDGINPSCLSAMCYSIMIPNSDKRDGTGDGITQSNVEVTCDDGFIRTGIYTDMIRCEAQSSSPGTSKWSSFTCSASTCGSINIPNSNKKTIPTHSTVLQVLVAGIDDETPTHIISSDP